MRELTQTWRDLFLVFRIALDVRKLLLGLLMLLTILLVGTLALGVLMWNVVDYQRGLELEPRVDEMEHFADLGLVEEGYTFAGLLGAALFEGEVAAEYKLEQVLEVTLTELGLVAHETAFYEPRGWTLGKILTFLVAALVLWLLLAPQLASLCRIAAVEIARDERIELATANRFARKKWGSLFFAPVMLWLFVALIFLLIALWGLIGSIPWVGPILAVILLPFVLFGGFLMVLASLGFVGPSLSWLAALAVSGALFLWLIGATTADGAATTTVALMFSTGGLGALVAMIIVFGGSPLIAPALATEGTDSFDSLSRAYNYFFSRFWHFLGYTFLGTAFGLLCIAFVWAFATLLIALAFLPAQWAWGEPVQRFLWAITFQSPELYALLSLGASVPYEGGFSAIWESDGFAMWLFALLGLMMIALVAGLALAFALAYASTMWTMIYFLLRRGVDGTEAKEVYLEDGEDHWLAPPADLEERIAQTAKQTSSTVASSSEETTQATDEEANATPATTSDAHGKTSPPAADASTTGTSTNESSTSAGLRSGASSNKKGHEKRKQNKSDEKSKSASTSSSSSGKGSSGNKKKGKASGNKKNKGKGKKKK